MKAFTIFQALNPNTGAPLVSLDSMLKMYRGVDGDPNGAQSGLNGILQGLTVAGKRFVVINTGLFYNPAIGYSAWALVAEGSTNPNPNNVAASIQFQTDETMIFW